MRRVIGKRTLDVDLAAERAGYDHVVLDVGTGDGKHVLALARRRPDALVIGLDASPDAMRATASSAARRAERGGAPNALFVWAAAESLPPGLVDVDEVHVLMPWGSLLRALVEPVPAVLAGIAARCRPGAEFLVTLNLHAWRPPVPEVGTSAEPTIGSVSATLAPAWADAGWHVEQVDHPDHDALAQLGTSWTKRLGSTRDALAVLRVSGRMAQPDGN